MTLKNLIKTNNYEWIRLPKQIIKHNATALAKRDIRAG